MIPDADRISLLDALGIFDRELRGVQEWQDWTSNLSHKFAIFNNFQIYPVKKIISLATNLPVSEFSGGDQSNAYVTSRGLKVISLRAFSWTIENGSVAAKILDKSAFLHRGTGIPVEIRPFFLEHDMVSGERRSISLEHESMTYSAHIDFESTDTARTRLFWNTDFSSLLKSSFPYHYQQYSNDLKPESEIIIKFKRLSGYDHYEISFAGEVAETTVRKDIEAEELEDIGPHIEGGIKVYFGKRYERSPVNRKKAIQIHGIVCNVCGFNFESVYGARGVDYIEVHHHKPISTYTEEQQVDPSTDLITLCSNCHRMIHRQPNNILAVEQLKTLIHEMRRND